MKAKKIERMKQIEHLEKMVLELEQWKKGVELISSTSKKVGHIDSITQRDIMIDLLKENISLMKNAKLIDNKLYLSEIVLKEKPEFGSNNLIIAPVGSGKTTLIKDVLIKGQTGKILMLASNTFLKDSLCPNDNEIRKERGDRTHTTKNKNIFGDEEYDIHVMSYLEFGSRIKTNDDFLQDIDQIYCDEIHSLPEYEQFDKSAELSHAIKVLFKKYNDKQIFYFTATDDNIKLLEKRQPEILRDVKTFDYLNHPEIKKFIALSKYKINNIEQIRSHLKARLESFNYFGYKCLAFNRTISGQKKIEQIAIEEGFKPLVLWSINNTREDYKMTEEQLEAREYLLRYEEIPEPYNFLIINSSMQEGWDLKDDMVKLAIMNTTNNTEKIQALGRLRNDIDILVYKVGREQEADLLIDVSNQYLEKPLTSYMKNVLCKELNIINTAGKISKWGAVSKLLINQGYKIKDEIKTIDGKRTRVSTIYTKNDN